MESPDGKPKGRIGIFLAMGTFETVSCLRDGVKLLASQGFLVDIFIASNPAYPEPNFNVDTISVVSSAPAVFKNGKVSLPKWTFGRGQRLYSWFVLQLYGRIWRSLVFRSLLNSRHARSRYVCLVGIDQEAIADAAGYADYLGVPFAYWSLELRFLNQCRNEQEKDLKKKDIEYSRRAAFSIVQDEWRKEALVKENGLDEEKIVLVPNAPMGRAQRKRSDFLRKRWAIPAEKKIIICPGTLAWWAMSKEIVEAALTWPDDYVLVMHSRRQPDIRGSEYEKGIMKLADQKKIIVSFDRFTAHDFDEFLHSGDAGLAFYNHASPYTPSGIDMNMQIMGLSSGKIADYLQHGLPIVVNRSLGPKNLVDDYECGVSVAQAGDIADALNKVFDDYDRYSKNACTCFDRRLELKQFFPSVIDRIYGLAQEKPYGEPFLAND